MDIGNEKKEENISFYDKITNETKIYKIFHHGEKVWFFPIAWIFPNNSVVYKPLILKEVYQTNEEVLSQPIEINNTPPNEIASNFPNESMENEIIEDIVDYFSNIESLILTLSL